MAYKNKTLINPITGQDILFLQTAKDTQGDYLEMESTYKADSREPPLHYHPYQTEDFTILNGELTVKHKGRKLVLKEGDTLRIQPNERHAMWNNSGKNVVVHWKVQPAMNTEYLFETINGLIRDGKTNKNGIPDTLQVSLIAGRFSDEFRLAKPPYIIQQFAFAVLRPIAAMMGKKAIYPQYID